MQKHFIESINQFHPDCIAISVLSDEVLIASNITAIAKKFFPHIPIIWGGKYPTLQPERTLLHYNADFACIGEGIEAFNDFLNALSGKENIELYSIPNIWAKKKPSL